MSGKKNAIRTILHYLRGKELSVRAAVNEMYEAEGPGTDCKHLAQNLFRCFKEDNNSLKNRGQGELLL